MEVSNERRIKSQSELLKKTTVTQKFSNINQDGQNVKPTRMKRKSRFDTDSGCNRKKARTAGKVEEMGVLYLSQTPQKLPLKSTAKKRKRKAVLSVECHAAVGNACNVERGTTSLKKISGNLEQACKTGTVPSSFSGEAPKTDSGQSFRKRLSRRTRRAIRIIKLLAERELEPNDESKMHQMQSKNKKSEQEINRHVAQTTLGANSCLSRETVKPCLAEKGSKHKQKSSKAVLHIPGHSCTSKNPVHGCNPSVALKSPPNVIVSEGKSRQSSKLPTAKGAVNPVSQLVAQCSTSTSNTDLKQAAKQCHNQYDTQRVEQSHNASPNMHTLKQRGKKHTKHSKQEPCRKPEDKTVNETIKQLCFERNRKISCKRNTSKRKTAVRNVQVESKVSSRRSSTETTAGQCVDRASCGSLSMNAETTVDFVSTKSTVSLTANKTTEGMIATKNCPQSTAEVPVNSSCKFLYDHRCTGEGLLPKCCYESEVGLWRCLTDGGRGRARRGRPPEVTGSQGSEAGSQGTCSVASAGSAVQRPSQTSTSATSEQNNSNELEIPGFYFDSATRKYFRILPSSAGVNSNAVTRDSISQRVAEHQRLADLSSPSSASKGLTSSERYVCAHRNMFGLMESAQRGMASAHLKEYELRRALVSNIKIRPRCCYGVHSNDHAFSERYYSNSTLLLPHPSDEAQLLRLYTDAGFSIIQQQLIPENFDTLLHRDVDELKLSDSLECAPLLCNNTAGSSLGWPCYSVVFDNTVQCAIALPSLIISVVDDEQSSVIYCHSLSQRRPNPLTCARLKEKNRLFIRLRATRCCAFNTCDGNELALGSERGVQLGCLDTWKNAMKVETREVLSLTYAHTTPHVLFAGTKNKTVNVYDRRTKRRESKSAWGRACLDTEGGVSNLYLTRDERHLVAANISGKIQKFDLRQGRSVLEYPGHVNDYEITTVGVDDREDFLYAVGADCRTRLWDFRSGKLLRTIPPPLPVHRDRIPAAYFSQSLGGRGGPPCLLLGMGPNVYLYTV